MKKGLKRLMSSIGNWHQWILICICTLFSYSQSLAQEMMTPGITKVPMKYAVKSPKYCWGQFFGRTEPQYNFPPQNICSPGMNHFCPGLVNLMQARESLDKNQKVRYLKAAEDNFLYTKRYIESYHECPLRRDVANALAEAQAGLMVFGR